MNFKKFTTIIFIFIHFQTVKTLNCKYPFLIDENFTTETIDIEISSCYFIKAIKPIIKSLNRSLLNIEQSTSGKTKLGLNRRLIIKEFIQKAHSEFFRKASKYIDKLVNFCNTLSTGCHDSDGIMFLILSADIDEDYQQAVLNTNKFDEHFEFPTKNDFKDDKVSFRIIPKQFREMINGYFDIYYNNLSSIYEFIIEDLTKISAVFFKNQSEKPILLSVLPTNSDRHNIKMVTSFISLQIDQQIINIVFKPSSVLIDFMITGDVFNFCKTNESLENEYFSFICSRISTKPNKMSFLQIVNNNLPDSTIKIYKILPIENFSSSASPSERIIFARGYIEKLSNLNEEYSIENAKEELKNTNRDILNDDKSHSDFFFNHFKNWLQNRPEKLTPEKLGLLWRDIGILTATLTLLASTDHHIENVLITKNGELVLIDLEATFRMRDSTKYIDIDKHYLLSVWACFHKNVGGFNFMVNRQVLSTQVHYERKNGQFFTSFVAVPNKVRYFPQNYPEKLTGIRYDTKFDDGLKKFHEFLGQTSFIDWFRSKILDIVIIREIPLGTQQYVDLTKSPNIAGEVNEWRSKLIEHSYESTSKKYDVLQIDRDNSFFSNILEFLGIKAAKEPEIHIPRVEWKYIFGMMSFMAFNQKTIKTLEQGLVPSYYTIANIDNLYTNDGVLVKDDLGGVDDTYVGPYFEQTPIDFVKERFAHFRTHFSQVQAMIHRWLDPIVEERTMEIENIENPGSLLSSAIVYPELSSVVSSIQSFDVETNTQDKDSKKFKENTDDADGVKSDGVKSDYGVKSDDVPFDGIKLENVKLDSVKSDMGNEDLDNFSEILSDFEDDNRSDEILVKNHSADLKRNIII